MELQEFLKMRRKLILTAIQEYRKIRFNARVLQHIAGRSLGNKDARMVAAAEALILQGFRVRQCAWRVLRRLYLWRIFRVYSWPWLLTPFPRGIDEHWARYMLPVYASFMENSLEFIKQADPECYAKMSAEMKALFQVTARQ